MSFQKKNPLVRSAGKYLLPYLSEAQKVNRLNWSLAHQDDPFDLTCDLDEKLFYMVCLKRSLKVPEGVVPTRKRVQHKSHIPKECEFQVPTF